MRKFPRVVELYCHERMSKQQMTRRGYSENTLNGHGKIVVAFEKSGKKILIHGLKCS